MGGVNIPLPALQARPPEQQNPLEQYARIQQIRMQQQQMQQQQQIAPLQVQQHQEELKAGQLQNRQTERDQADQQAIQQTLAAAPGATFGDVLPQLRGRIQPKTWAQLYKADMDMKKELSAKTEQDLSNAAAQHKMYSDIYDNVMQMPDQAVAQNWPQIANAISQVPGNKLPVDPQQPMTKQQIQQMAPMLSLNDAYLQKETAKREANAKAKLAEEQAAAGGTSDVDKYSATWLQAHNLPDTPANRLKAHAAFTKETKTDPGVARVSVLLQRPTEVADPNQPGQTLMVPQSQAAGMAGKSSASVQIPRATEKYMTSGKGGQQITAYNTAIAHLDTLREMGSALGNGNIQAFNKVAQRYSQETGNPAPANFDAAKAALSGEVASALKASGATDQEIGKVESTFSRAQSPGQINGAINTYQTLLKSKREALKKQNQFGMKGKPAFGDEQPQAEVTATGPNGHKIAVRNGKWVDAATGQPIQ